MNSQLIIKIGLFALLALIIFISPIFVGSVEPFSKMLLRIEIISLFILWAVYSCFFNDYEEKTKFGLSFLLILLFIAVCIFQLIPFPKFIVETISPNTSEIWNTNSKILNYFDFKNSAAFQTLSIVPHYSLNKLLSIMCFVLLGFVISKIITSRNYIRILIWIFAFTLIVETLFGYFQFFSGNTYFAEPSKHISTGTFVNKNHFAGFLELTIPLILSYAFYLIQSFWNESSLKERSFNTLQIFIFSAIGALALIVFIFSFSRMGYISLLSSIVLLFVFYSKTTGNFNRKMLIPLALILLFLFFGIYKSYQTFSTRVSITGTDIIGRATLYKDTITAIKDFPFFGTGLGTFKVIYPGYKTLEVASTANYAHNDYLQLALETGLIGFSLLISALVLFLRSTLLRLKLLYENDEMFYFYIKFGCLGGILSILIHSLSDFNLHIPSNAAYFSILIGIITCKEDFVSKPISDSNINTAIPLSIKKRRKYKK